MAAYMDLIGVPSTLPNAIDRANTDHSHYVLSQVLNAVPRGRRVGVLGLAYKPGAPMIDRSFGIDLAGWLAAEGRQVVGWDPMANEAAASVLGGRITIASSPQECLRCDAVVIALPLSELAVLDWSQTADTTIIDCWRTLDVRQRSFARNYIPLGIRDGQKSDPLEGTERADRFAHLTN